LLRICNAVAFLLAVIVVCMVVVVVVAAAAFALFFFVSSRHALLSRCGSRCQEIIDGKSEFAQVCGSSREASPLC
jgi:hypothetical protein